MKLKLILSFCLCAIASFGQTSVSSNEVLVIGTNGVLRANKTNFFAANAALLNASVTNPAVVPGSSLTGAITANVSGNGANLTNIGNLAVGAMIYSDSLVSSQDWIAAALSPPGLYVDSIYGSDTNPGTVSAPLRHLAAVTAMLSNVVAGPVNVYLKRGSKFYESFDVTNYSVSDYGVGEKPRITGVTNLANGYFSLTAGKTNTYQYPLVVPPETNTLSGGTIVQSNVMMVWQNNGRMGQRWDQNASYNNNTNTAIASVDGNPNSFFYDLTNHVLYINPGANGSPVTNGLVYEASIRTLALYGGYGCTVSNIIAEKVYAHDSSGNQGYPILGYYSGLYVNCVGRYGWNHLIGLAPALTQVGTNIFSGCYGYDVETNITYTAPAAVFIADANSATNQVWVTFTNCMAALEGPPQVVGDNQNVGFAAHELANLTVQIDNCVASNCYFGFQMQTNVFASGNVAVSCYNGGSAVDAANTVTNFSTYGCTNGVRFLSPSTNAIVNDCAFYNCSGNCIYTASTEVNTYATNNIFASTNNLGFAFSGTAGVFYESFNNSFYMLNYAYNGGTMTNLAGATEANNNNYYGNTRYSGSQNPSPGYAITFANWQSLWPGIDANSTFSNPGYTTATFTYNPVEPSGPDADAAVAITSITSGGLNIAGYANMSGPLTAGSIVYAGTNVNVAGTNNASYAYVTNNQTVGGNLTVGGTITGSLTGNAATAGGPPSVLPSASGNWPIAFYDGAEWLTVSPGASPTINGSTGAISGIGSGLTEVPLSGLAQSSAATGQVAEWNGSSWVPGNASGAGGNNYNPANFKTNGSSQIDVTGQLALLANDNGVTLTNMPGSGLVATAGRQSLRNWDSVLASINANAVTNATICWMGDSWVFNNIAGPLGAALQRRYGYSGDGFVPFGTSTLFAIPGRATLALAGTWNQSNFPTNTADQGSAYSADTSTPATATLTSMATTFVIHYLAQTGGGSFSYAVDGGSATTVNTSTGGSEPAIPAFATNGGLTQNALHSLKITITSAGTTGVVIAGVDCQNSQTGVRIEMLGYGGTTSSNWVYQTEAAPSAQYQTILNALNPTLIMIGLGVNDAGAAAGITGLQYATNMIYLAQQYTAVNTNCDVLLWTTGPSTNVLYNTAYSQPLAQLCLSNGYAFFDSSLILGNWYLENGRGLAQDTKHPNSIGGRLLADALAQMLCDHTSMSEPQVNFMGADSVVITPGLGNLYSSMSLTPQTSVLIGQNAGLLNTNSGNVFIGNNAGYGNGATTACSNDTQMTLIGGGATRASSAPSSGIADSTGLGNGASVTKSHQVVLGSSTVTQVLSTAGITLGSSGQFVVDTSGDVTAINATNTTTTTTGVATNKGGTYMPSGPSETNVGLANANFIYENSAGQKLAGTFGSGLSFSGGTVTASGGGSGTVTSVAAAADSTGVIASWSGSPITASGTLTPTFASVINSIVSGSSGASSGQYFGYNGSSFGFYTPSGGGGGGSTSDLLPISFTNSGGATKAAIDASGNSTFQGTVNANAIIDTNTLTINGSGAGTNTVISATNRTINAYAPIPQILIYDKIQTSPSNVFYRAITEFTTASTGAVAVLSNAWTFSVGNGSNLQVMIQYNVNRVAVGGSTENFASAVPASVLFTNTPNVGQGELAVNAATAIGNNSSSPTVSYQANATGWQVTYTPGAATQTHWCITADIWEKY
jgi:lysophospholipase L1-like esterase